MRFKRSFLLLSFLLLFSLNIFGQDKPSLRTVRGSVHLQNGTSVQEAHVRLFDAKQGTSASVSVDKDGSFILTKVPEGQYRLQVSMSGVLAYDEPLPASAF